MFVVLEAWPLDEDRRSLRGRESSAAPVIPFVEPVLALPCHQSAGIAVTEAGRGTPGDGRGGRARRRGYSTARLARPRSEGRRDDPPEKAPAAEGESDAERPHSLAVESGAENRGPERGQRERGHDNRTDLR